MAYMNYTQYSLIREDNQETYYDKKAIIKNKIRNADKEKLSISETLSYFTGIDISLLERAIEQFGASELSKHLYSIELSAAKCKKLELLLSLYQDIYTVEAKKQFNVNSPNKIADFLYSQIGSSPNENFYVIFLNAKCDVLGSELLFVGGCSQCVVDIPIIFKKAIVNGAVNIVIAHNHPSGNPSPSLEDTNITKAIKTAGDLLKVQLLDHVVVGSINNYFSFKENALI